MPGRYQSRTFNQTDDVRGALYACALSLRLFLAVHGAQLMSFIRNVKNEILGIHTALPESMKCLAVATRLFSAVTCMYIRNQKMARGRSRVCSTPL